MLLLINNNKIISCVFELSSLSRDLQEGELISFNNNTLIIFFCCVRRSSGHRLAVLFPCKCRSSTYVDEGADSVNKTIDSSFHPNTLAINNAFLVIRTQSSKMGACGCCSNYRPVHCSSCSCSYYSADHRLNFQ